MLTLLSVSNDRSAEVIGKNRQCIYQDKVVEKQFGLKTSISFFFFFLNLKLCKCACVGWIVI